VITREYINQRLAEKAEKLKDPCDRPRCGAKPGEECKTPNGYRTHHKSRGRLAAVKRPHRLSDAQAQRIEWAAENGVFYAPGQWANLRGDATKRACADALERARLVEQVGWTDAGERIFRLTEAGWGAYHESPLVIRRVPDEQHPPVCPCRPSTPFEQVVQVNAIPEAQPAKAALADRWEELRKEVPAPQFTLRNVSAQARTTRKPLGPIRTGSNVVDITARLAARHASTSDGGAA
jgi:hypothetical protein